MGVLRDHTIVGIGRNFLAHQAFKFLLIEGTRMPLTRVIRLHSSNIQASIHTSNSTVAKERQGLRIWHLLIRREQGTRVANRQQGRNRPTALLRQNSPLRVTLESNSQAI